MSNLKRSIYANISPLVGATAITKPGLLLSNLILFEEVILRTNGFLDICDLVKLYSPQTCTELLRSGAVKIDHSPGAIVSFDYSKAAKPGLYQMDFGTAHYDYEKVLERNIRNIEKLKNEICIPKAEYLPLMGAVENVLLNPKRTRFTDSVLNAKGIFSTNKTFVRQKVADLIHKKIAVHLDQSKFNINIFITTSGMFVETNLDSLTGLSPSDCFKIIQDAFFALANLFSAMEISTELNSNFVSDENDDAQFNNTLSSLVRIQTGNAAYNTLRKVMEINSLPNLDLNPQSVDIIRLLDIRNNPEIEEFRSWISRAEDFDDQHLNEIFNSLNAKLKELYNSPAGKIMRIGIATSINPVAGLGLAVLEAFILDRLTKPNAPVSFVTEEIGSIFPYHSR